MDFIGKRRPSEIYEIRIQGLLTGERLIFVECRNTLNAVSNMR